MDLDEDTHLALSLEGVVSRYDDPGVILQGLKERVGELGIVSDDAEPHVIMDLGRRTDVHIDFYSHRPGKLEALKRAMKEDHPVDTRYLFLGSGKRDSVIAEKAGWTYIDIDDAKELDRFGE